MRKDTSDARKPKERHRVRNWSAYNAGLIDQGNVTMWIAQGELAVAPDTTPVRGRPRIYSDAVIHALLDLKAVFRCKKL